MSRKVCIRKHWAKIDPIALAIAGASLIGERDLDKLRMLELGSIEEFAKGVATIQDHRSLCDLLNLAETMGKMGIGPEVLPVCEAVQEHLLRAAAQYEECGRMTLTAAGLKALRDIYEYHELQRTAVDRSTYERAIVRTKNVIRGGHPSVKVLV